MVYDNILYFSELYTHTYIYNVRTLAVKGKNGYGHDEHVLAKGRQLGCTSIFIGLDVTRRSGSTTFRAAAYRVFCSGQEKQLPDKGCTE